jgi:hypothetical protein
LDQFPGSAHSGLDLTQPRRCGFVDSYGDLEGSRHKPMIHHTWFRVALIVVLAVIALLAVRLHVAAAITG